jgi:hypothetical protein
LKEQRYLRVTGLPVGTYEVIGKQVVHRYDPAKVISELGHHQRRERLRSKPFLDAVRRLAKRVGGRVEPAVDELTNVFLGYRIKLKRAARLALAPLQRELDPVAGYVFKSSVLDDELGVGIGDRLVDVIRDWVTHGTYDEGVLAKLIDECGATIERLSHDLIELPLDRAPKNPASYARALGRLNEDAEPGELLNGLRQKRLFLWWD